MNQIHRIALLEDNEKQLHKLEDYLSKISNVQVVIKSKNSNDFFEQLETAYPDILITDLDLGNDSMTGMEVAHEKQIPVFFASINTADYIEDIENLKRDAEICVDHITKPFTEEKFIKSFKRFVKEVELFANVKYLHLNFDKTKRNKIFIDEIVYLSADKSNGSESNNKKIHFINRNSETLIDFSFSKMEQNGFPPTQFVTIHKSFRVNKKYIEKYLPKTKEIEVKVFDTSSTAKIVRLMVSENYQSVIKNLMT